MTGVSLFTGAGGLDWGFHRLGFAVALANDIKKDAAETYVENYGGAVADGTCTPAGRGPCYVVGGVESLTFSALKISEPDVLFGGPPCQDFSIMRGPEAERQGTKTARGKLYLHFLRAVINLKPKVVIFENVPGIRTSNRGLDLDAIITDFSDMKGVPDRVERQNRLSENPVTFPEPTPPGQEIPEYELIFQGIVDASHFGVPQKRRRFILIAVRKDLLSSKKLKSDVENLAASATLGNSLFRLFPLTALEALEGDVLPNLQSVYEQIVSEYLDLKGWETPSRSIVDAYLERFTPTRGHQDPLFQAERMEALQHFDEAMEAHLNVLKKMGWLGKPLDRAGSFPDGSNEPAKEQSSVVIRMRHIPPGENHTFVDGTAHSVKGRGFSLVYRRLHPLEPAYTVVAHGGGGTWGYHYRRSRSRLTNRERARLQSFPDAFLFKGRIAQVRAQIGEAVPPLLSEALAEIAADILDAVGSRRGGALRFAATGAGV